MNKNEFLMRLRKALASLPFEECQSAMKYYEEYFAEAGEDREGDILKELGSPEMLAATILGEYSSAPARTAAPSGYADPVYSSASGYGESRTQEQEQEPWYRRTPLWVLILLGICLSPVIMPLIGAVIAILAAALGIAASLVAIMASFGIAGVISLISGIVAIVVGAVGIVINPASGLMTIGVGLLLAAIGILTILLSIWLFASIVPTIFRTFVALLRRIFKRGGAVQ